MDESCILNIRDTINGLPVGPCKKWWIDTAESLSVEYNIDEYEIYYNVKVIMYPTYFLPWYIEFQSVDDLIMFKMRYM